MDGLRTLLKNDLSRFPELYGNERVTQITYAPVFWNKTYEQLEKSTNKVIGLISETLGGFNFVRDRALENSGKTGQVRQLA